MPSKNASNQDSPSKKPPCGLIVRRWISVIACTALGTLFVYLCWPVVETASEFLQARLEPLPYWLHLAVSSVLVALIFWPLHKLGGFRGRHPFKCRVWRYPSLWPFAVGAGASVSCWMAGMPMCRVSMVAILPIGIGLVAAMVFTCLRAKILSGDSPPESIGEYDERPISHQNDDLFNFTPRAKRIAESILTTGNRKKRRTVLIIGDYGSGKSSMANLVYKQLVTNSVDSANTPILVRADLWGVDSDRIDQALLARCREEVSLHADALSIARLPQDYATALGEFSSGWIKAAASILKSPEDASRSLRRLNTLLQTTGLEFVVVIEDADRRAKTRDLHEMSALLDRSIELDRITWIATITDPALAGLDHRVASQIETLGEILYRTAETKLADLVQTVLESGTIDPVAEPRRISNILFSDPLFRDYCEHASFDLNEPGRAMTECCRNPRNLKRIRRIFSKDMEVLHSRPIGWP